MAPIQGSIAFFGLVITVVSSILGPTSVLAQDVWDVELLTKFETAADMALLAFFDEPENRNNYDFLTSFRGGEKATFTRAVVTAKDGICYASYPGAESLLNIPQVIQYGFTPGFGTICPIDENGNTNEDCSCQTGFGTFETYTESGFRAEMLQEILDCVDSRCPTTQDCVVLSGFSQGGDFAQVVAVQLSNRLAALPMVVSFGSQSELTESCGEVIDAVQAKNNWYYMVNSKRRYLWGGLEWDPFPIPEKNGDYFSFGTTAFLSDDDVGAVVIDGTTQRHPTEFLGLKTHRILGPSEKEPGYRDRMEAYLAEATRVDGPGVVTTTGFSSGSACSRDDDCESNDCGSFLFFFPAECN